MTNAIPTFFALGVFFKSHQRNFLYRAEHSLSIIITQVVEWYNKIHEEQSSPLMTVQKCLGAKEHVCDLLPPFFINIVSTQKYIKCRNDSQIRQIGSRWRAQRQFVKILALERISQTAILHLLKNDFAAGKKWREIGIGIKSIGY